MNTFISLKHQFISYFLLFLIIVPIPSVGNTYKDVNLVFVIRDCITGSAIANANIIIPTAAVHVGSQSQSITNEKGFARIYPLRFGNQTHDLIAEAVGYERYEEKRTFKAWSSYEIELCLNPSTNLNDANSHHHLLFAWSEKYPIPYANNLPKITDCQCVSYWSRYHFGSVLSIGVAGLSPDLMVNLDYFSQIPIEYGIWQEQIFPRKGDTIIIQPNAFMYRYSFTGHAYKEYYQPRPGHIGIIESVTYLDGIDIFLVGKQYDTFYGWRIRFRNANWPAAWMENNRYYPERVGHQKDEIVCNNVGVSDIIIPKEHPLITFWGKN